MAKGLTIKLICLVYLLICFGCTNIQHMISDLVNEADISQAELTVFSERIPGSIAHSSDGTWWGYNQSKITRFGDTVYTVVVEDNENYTTLSKLTLYQKRGDGTWEKGASVPTSRPGNVLVDSTGIVHTIVFEPLNVAENDSLGQLKHYSFLNAAAGDITNYTVETIIENDGSEEMINIRNGAVIGSNDEIAVAFGLTEGQVSYNGHTKHFYIKESSSSTWTHHIAGENLGHDFYYSYPLISQSGYHIFAVQDDNPPQGEGNIYQMLAFFDYDGNTWNNEIVADMRGLPNAYENRDEINLEHSELFEDSSGQIHLLWKQRPQESVTEWYHAIGSLNNFNITKVSFSDTGLSWVRLAEVDSQLYYIAATWDRLYIQKVGAAKLKEIPIASDMAGIYLYVAGKKQGVPTDAPYIDILLLNGGADYYPNAPNYYVRLTKSELDNI